MRFSHLGVFLILVKPLTTENAENKATPKICKITELYTGSKLENQFTRDSMRPAKAVAEHSQAIWEVKLEFQIAFRIQGWIFLFDFLCHSRCFSSLFLIVTLPRFVSFLPKLTNLLSSRNEIWSTDRGTDSQ